MKSAQEQRSVAARLLGAVISGYQRFVSPLMVSRCRFHPSCSEYAREAIERLGAPRGIYLAIRRLLRCHPLHPGGFDPVPDPLPDGVQRADEGGSR